MLYGRKYRNVWILPPSFQHILSLKLFFLPFFFFKAEEQLKLLPILVSTKCLEIMAFEVSSFLKQKRKPGVDIKEEAILLSSNYGLSMLLHAHPIPRCFAL